MPNSVQLAFCAAAPLRGQARVPPTCASVCRRRPRACAETAPTPTPADEAVEAGATPRTDVPMPGGGGASYINVPGKVQLTADQLAAQKQRLDRLEEQFKQERLVREYEQSRKFGFVEFAETLNGRLAMTFFMTGLLT